MATTKKRTKKTGKSAASPRTLTSLADRMKLMRDDLVQLVEDVEVAVASASTDEPLSQDLLAAFTYLSALGYSLDKLTERAKLSAKEWRGTGGFDKSPCAGHALAVVGFNVTKGARRPKWQEIAAEAAGELASLEGAPFDEDVYLDKIKTSTVPGKDAEKVSFTFAE